MSEHPELTATQVEGSEYEIGSRSRSLLRLGVLTAMILVALIIHYLFLRKLTDLAFPLLIFSWMCILFWFWGFGHGDLFGWIDFLLKDSAYGTVAVDGIRYNRMVASRFLPWRLVARVEYSPLDGNRLSVFRIGRRTFSCVRPLSFGPGSLNSRASAEIEKILLDRGEHEKFVITDQTPATFVHL